MKMQRDNIGLFVTICMLAAVMVLAMGEGELSHASDVRLMAGASAERSSEKPSDMPKGVIGVSLHVGAERVGDQAVLYVAHVHPEGPAQKAGLAHGDEVVAVDGQSVNGKTYEQVVMMIRGEIGTTVKLTVKGEGGSRDLSIGRVAGESLYKGGMDSHGNPSR